MSLPASEARRYFLGITGEQSGPFSEDEVFLKIRKNLVPADSLIWYEGLADWQPIVDTDPFKETFAPSLNVTSPLDVSTSHLDEEEIISDQDEMAELDLRSDSILENSYASAADLPSAPEEKALPSAPAPYLVSDSATAAPTIRAPREEAMAPVFTNEEAAFRQETWWSSLVYTKSFIVFLSIAAVLCVGGLVYLVSGNFSESKPFVPKKPVTKSADMIAGERQLAVNQALSELNLNTETSLNTLKSIAETNGADKAGKEAIQGVLDYYKGAQKAAEAARFLIKLKRPGEALPLFLESPSTVKEAEAAAYAAYQSATGESEMPARRTFLLEDIRMLLGPLNNLKLATERIRLLEKEFPGKPHPYGYYLKSIDGQIADLFSRISFVFVQSLLSFVSSELSQLVLLDRPLVEIRRNHEGRYRIVASYRGGVGLNQDHLSDIKFVFWLVGDQWVIIDTNLTPERAQFAESERAKYANRDLTGTDMLNYLQLVFRKQFPKSLLHEPVSSETTPKEKDF